jgi:hypothetical protein
MDIETKEQELRNERNESLANYAKLEAQWRQVVAERDELKAELEKQLRWISVDQELPPEGKPVLTYRDGYQEVAVYSAHRRFPFETHSGLKVFGPSHWRRLDWPAPIAPKEGEGDR